MSEASSIIRRPILANGEGLRKDVSAPKPGGGNKFDPQTPEEARVLLAPKVADALRAAKALPPTLRADRLLVEAKLLPNYIAPSSFPGNLLSRLDAIPVGSRAETGIYRTKTRSNAAGTRRLILSLSDAGLDTFNELLQQGAGNKFSGAVFEDLKTLDDVSLSQPPLKQLEQDASLWEAVLHPETDRSGRPTPLSQATLEKWKNLISSLGGEVLSDYVRTVGGLTFTAVELPAGSAVDASRFNPLRVLRPMPGIRPRPGFGTRSIQALSAPAVSPHPSDQPRVAVFDGGLDGITPFFPEGSTDLTTEPSDVHDLSHGAGVGGAASYGLVQPGDTPVPPPLPVDHYRVLPAPHIRGDLEGYWVLDRISEVLREGRHSIVNLSLGPALAVEEDQEPNLWTSTLDQLAWDHNILFVVAAGNDGDKDAQLGLHRVQVPADMVNGISVGASDAPAPTKPWGRAPYSSMGPGRQGSRIQPSCLQFGGVAGNEFLLMKTDGNFQLAAGTSFAAPVVTHALSRLTTRIPSYSPNVLRAFVAHFAERHRTRIKLINEVGYGRLPLTFDDNLDCSPDEVHVLFTDVVKRKELIGYQVPIPAASSGDLQVQISLAYASPIDPAEATEYTQASVELGFRPHDQMYSFRSPKGESSTIYRTLDRRSDDALDLTTAGWTPGQEPVTKGLGTAGPATESQLRDEGKWETVRSTRISLRENEVLNPRLEVSYLARQSGGALDSSPSEIPFALLISVIDKSKSGTLYDQARAQFPVLQPMQRVQPRLRART